MPRDSYEEFVEFLELHPEYYHILNSGIFLRLLDILTSSPRSFSELIKDNPNIEPEDLKAMLSVLLSIGIINRTEGSDNQVFYANETSKEMLQKFEKVKDRCRVV